MVLLFELFEGSGVGVFEVLHTASRLGTLAAVQVGQGASGSRESSGGSVVAGARLHFASTRHGRGGPTSMSCMQQDA